MNKKKSTAEVIKQHFPLHTCVAYIFISLMPQPVPQISALSRCDNTPTSHQPTASLYLYTPSGGRDVLSRFCYMATKKRQRALRTNARVNDNIMKLSNITWNNSRFYGTWIPTRKEVKSNWIIFDSLLRFLLFWTFFIHFYFAFCFFTFCAFSSEWINS